MDVVDYRADHLARLDVQDNQRDLMRLVTDEQAEALVNEGWSHSCVEGNRVYGCAGIIPLWPGRALAWSYLSLHATGSKFLAVHRAVQRRLNECYIKRIEMTVSYDHEEAHRWARMLGFVMEAPHMEAYLPDGTACSLYARVR